MMAKLAKHKNILCGFSFLLVIVLIFLVSGSPAIVSTSLAAKKLPVYCVQRDDNYASLTFDAAWGDVILRQWQSVLWTSFF